MINDHPLPFLWISLTAITVPWLFYNFGMYDLGFHAVKAAEALHHPESAFWEPTWLTSILTGLWLELTGRSLFALRIAALLCILGIASLIFAILRPYYGRIATALATILPLLLLMSGAEHFIPSYYIVPPLFGSAAILFCLRSIEATTDRRALIHALLGGLASAGLLFARLPSGLLLLLYPVVSFLLWRSGAKRRSAIVPIGALIGLIAGLSIAVALLKLAGYWSPVEVGIRAIVDSVGSDGGENIHNPFRLLIDTVIRYAKVVGAGAGLILCCWVWRKVFPHRTPSSRDPFVLLLILVVVVATVLLSLIGAGSFPLPLGAGLALFLFGAVHVYRTGDRHRFILFVCAALYMVMMNAGSSNNMSFSLKYTALLIVPLGFLETRRMVSSSVSLPVARLVLVTNLIALFLISRLVNESRFVFALDGEFDAPALGSTYTDSSTAASYNALTRALTQAGVRQGDTLLGYVDIPMINFSSATVPGLQNAWISNHAVGYPSIALIDSMVTREGLRPHFIVRANPLKTTGAKLDYLDSLWRAYRYDTVWRSDDYILMMRPDEEIGR